jgi:gas vesicle protein
MSKNTNKFAVGALFAAAAGYVTGLLTAPKSGKETRKDIHDAALKARNEAEKKLKQAHSELQDLLDRGNKVANDVSGKAKDGFQDALKNAATAKEKAKGLLSAMHEGDSNDKDLQKAIKEADSAIEHLKSYVAKNEDKNTKSAGKK